MQGFRVLLLLCLLLSGFPAAAQPQEIMLKSGESTDVFEVYWIDTSNCRSQLNRILGIDILSGPEGLSASIREQTVTARRQHCSQQVPGGWVVFTAGNVAAPVKGPVQFRVRYDTTEGQRQSSHTRQVALFP
ncbi:hypothetical protein V6B08_20580 [Ferrovibrio sp. MS7]|jgi:hypothetical protein|uniref:hypothetical protein n=1 Tax=Ferrovibrio plantarum TaxID=3119164 RepID=UPI001B7B12A9|nr:hypothetical protein [Ferrovibrio sp.]